MVSGLFAHINRFSVNQMVYQQDWAISLKYSIIAMASGLFAYLNSISVNKMVYQQDWAIS